MIKTLECDTIPLSIKDGLPHMEMRKPVEHDWKTLPQVIMPSDCPCDPADHDEERDICEFLMTLSLPPRLQLPQMTALILIPLQMMIMGRHFILMS